MNDPLPASGGTWLRHPDGSLEEVPPGATNEDLAAMIAARDAERAPAEKPPEKPPGPRKPSARTAVKED